MNDPRQPRTDAPPMKDEPELANEESVPSDGKDHQGERMMEELGRHKPGRPLAPDHAQD